MTKLSLRGRIVLEHAEPPLEPIEVAAERVARPIYRGLELMRFFIHCDVSLTVSVVRGSVEMVRARRRPASSAA